MGLALNYSPIQNSLLLKAIPSWQQIIAVILELVGMATVMDPDMRHTRDPTGKAQEVFPGSTMLICNQETLVGRVTLEGKEQKLWAW